MSMGLDCVDRITVDTPVGEYAITVNYDQDADNPLADFDHPGMAFVIDHDRHAEEYDMDATGRAGEVLRVWLDEYVANDCRAGVDVDAVERRFALWRAITGSPWVLVTGQDSSSRSDHYHWFVLVDTADYSPQHSPEKNARAEMETYRAWASGEVFGYVVTGPDGQDVEDGSCWGFYDRADIIDSALEAIDYDVSQRQKNASLVGAGFVGLI